MFEVKDACGGKVMFFPAGLERMVRKLLLDAGYHVVAIDEWEHLDGGRAEWLPAPSGGRFVDIPMLDAIRAGDRVLVRYRHGHALPANLIDQIARTWPKKKIYAAATRHRDVRVLAKQLQSDMPDTVPSPASIPSPGPAR